MARSLVEPLLDTNPNHTIVVAASGSVECIFTPQVLLFLLSRNSSSGNICRAMAGERNSMFNLKCHLFS